MKKQKKLENKKERKICVLDIPRGNMEPSKGAETKRHIGTNRLIIGV